MAPAKAKKKRGSLNTQESMEEQPPVNWELYHSHNIKIYDKLKKLYLRNFGLRTQMFIKRISNSNPSFKDHS
jgi:hypothetical protein